MNNIMTKTYELIDVLDSSDIIKNIELYKNRVLSNNELLELINKGNDNSIDKYALMDIKHRLYKNSDYKNYIDNYNKLFYIVMDINNRFNKLTSDKVCHK